ncbi:MAG: HAMP domain-containing histidine kinase [Paramuribaculum sp.]|nr:HAMP domain-containing histidine kinase [Paramuribaculum sp.]
MLKDIYLTRRRGAWALLIAAAAVVVFFLYFSNGLVKNLSAQERERMEIWADATRRLATDSQESQGTDVDFMLSVIEANHTIPLLLVDSGDNIIFHRNLSLPEPLDSIDLTAISPKNSLFLTKQLRELKKSGNKIDIQIDSASVQQLYYRDSTVLQRLGYYPYVQTLVMLAFVAMVYFAVTSTKKAEQNKVWVGLTKETAHQLGTPISSLMAWTQMLAAEGIDPNIVNEMDKDVNRLASVASRFSKVGSRPGLEPESTDAIVAHCCDYMRTRISKSVQLSETLTCPDAKSMICAPLLEWVMENLIKNAVDAMDGVGKLSISTSTDPTTGKSVIEVSDTGKGIPRKHFKTIFRPGFTTKKRGWGLGLTLARRIIEDYHHGRIFVKSSEPDKGTTIRIELPQIKD